MTKGTLSIEVKCANCGSAVLEFPDHLTDSTLIHCTNCGKNLGPYGAIVAALQGQAHTPIGAHPDVIVKPFKPIK